MYQKLRVNFKLICTLNPEYENVAPRSLRTNYNLSRKLFSVKNYKSVFKDFRGTLNSKLRFYVQGHITMNMLTPSWESVKSLMLDSVQKIDLLKFIRILILSNVAKPHPLDGLLRIWCKQRKYLPVSGIVYLYSIIQFHCPRYFKPCITDFALQIIAQFLCSW